MVNRGKSVNRGQTTVSPATSAIGVRDISLSAPFNFCAFSRLTVETAATVLPQPPNPLRCCLQVPFQCGKAFAKSDIESRFLVQAIQIGLSQRQCLAPLGGADLAVETGSRQRGGEFAAAARGKGHGEHVVGRGKLVGAAAVGDEGEVAGVHVSVADQCAEGVQQAGGFVRLASDVALGEQACGHGRPAAAAEADEFGVHGAEGDKAAPTVRADAVKPFDFEKALLAVVDDARGDGGDVVFAEQREGVVFGQ